MGWVHIIRDFYSPPEEMNRTLRIYTPSGYEADPNARFPVLYMQDGQNVFAHPESATWHTWCANDVMERLAGEGRFRRGSSWESITARFVLKSTRRGTTTKWAFAAAASSTRNFSCTTSSRTSTKPTGRAPSRNGRRRWGRSLGGLMALFLGWKYPEVFGRVGGVSPSLMWSQGGLFHAWTKHSGRWSRIYLDAGEHEWVDWGGVDLDYGNTVRSFYEHLRAVGYADHEVRLVLEPGGNHHEIDWQRRLPETFRWLLSA
ncbi:MAG: alpha/beta hydrolase-fold protein [Deltaproteobacteria bacterium]|nr:alpha/beta hydrolase-fold protein [Deltaproteobacteria bacterium]